MIVQLGELYSPDHTTWPETMSAIWVEDALCVQLFFGTPSAQEIKAITSGRIELALYDKHPACLTLCIRVMERPATEVLPWSDMPFSVHKHTPEGPVYGYEPETLGSKTCLGVQVHLIDADTGVLVAMQQGEVTPAWTKRWAYAIKDQLDAEFNEDRYQHAQKKFHATTKSTKELMQSGDVVRSVVEN